MAQRIRLEDLIQDMNPKIVGFEDHVLTLEFDVETDHPELIGMKIFVARAALPLLDLVWWDGRSTEEHLNPQDPINKV